MFQIEFMVGGRKTAFKYYEMFTHMNRLIYVITY